MISNGKHGLAAGAGGNAVLIAKIVLTLLGAAAIILFLLYWAGAVHGGAVDEPGLIVGSLASAAVA